MRDFVSKEEKHTYVEQRFVRASAFWRASYASSSLRRNNVITENSCTDPIYTLRVSCELREKPNVRGRARSSSYATGSTLFARHCNENKQARTYIDTRTPARGKFILYT